MRQPPYDWQGALGNNFSNMQPYDPYREQLMNMKNLETDGGYQASVSGAYGEFTVASVFKALPDEYAVLNDILIQTGKRYRRYNYNDFLRYGATPWELVSKDPKTRQFVPESGNSLHLAVERYRNTGNNIFEVVKQSSQLDHVIVSPYGIFIIETKNHKGWIYGDVNGRVWTQVIHGEQERAGLRAHGNYSRFTFYNPVAQNEQHLNWLSKAIKIPRQYMVGFIVFTSNDADLSNVNCPFCMTTSQLAVAIQSYTRQLWSSAETDAVIKRIEKVNSSSYSLSKEHVTFVKDLQHRAEVNRMLR